MRVFMIILFLHFFAMNIYGQVGIGTATPHVSAQLDVTSTTKGFLLPRMTTAERNAISNPSPGLMIFNTTTQSMEIFASTRGWFGIQPQVPERRLLGSIGLEEVADIKATSDGGYIVAGTTDNRFPNGDITDSGRHGGIGSPSGATDCWIVKLDAQHNIEWNKILGGIGTEEAFSIQLTTDGGYIVAASSTSSNSRDVVETTHGGTDYWIVKLKSDGSIQWTRQLGGASTDIPSSIQLTSDGGYIVAGNSRSSATGDVTGINHGINDYWIVKLGPEGNIVWQQLLGGIGTELTKSLQQTIDGGYIIAGTSNGSTASGDVSGINRGSTDYWIVKLKGDGQPEWEKLLGGSYADLATSIRETENGDFIVAGSTASSANGDVTGTNYGPLGTTDSWVVKLDKGGVVIWNKLLGANGSESVESLIVTAKEIFLAGYSYSSASGDVSSVNHGNGDYWIVKLNESGKILWNRLLGGSGEDEAYSIQPIADGGYIIAGNSRSSGNGNVISLNHGFSDIWIIKLDVNGILY